MGRLDDQVFRPASISTEMLMIFDIFSLDFLDTHDRF